MEPNAKQPKLEVKKNVAALARAGRLTPFNDLDMIDRYSERFGQDPDRQVFTGVSFETITAFMVMWKEKTEYEERFSYIWNELTAQPGK